MLKRLNDEPTSTAPGSVSASMVTKTNDSTKSGEAVKMTPASMAAMLTASTSSRMIVQSVLSSFAAEATMSSGLSKSEKVPDTNGSLPVYNNSQNQTPTTQGQYHVIPYPPPPPPPQFPYGIGNIPLMPPGLPPPLPQMPQLNSCYSSQQSQQAPTLQPPGTMYYGALHHS